MIIRKADKSDLKKAYEVYSKVLKNEENGLTTIGWIRGVYPTEDTIQEAINADDFFVYVEDDKILACARINQIQVPEYAVADWEYKDIKDDKIMVLHTLAVDPDAGGKEIGSNFVKFYEDYALDHGCTHLRMDTNEKNSNARRLYKKLGYNEADIVPCDFNGIPNIRLVCLEKKLKG